MNKRPCYLCGGRLILESQKQIDKNRYELYLHCSVCKSKVLYMIPIRRE